MADVIRSVPLFSECSRKELSLLAGIAEERDVAAGESIVRQGETGIGLEIVLEGDVRVEIDGETRRHLGPGAFFGEIALLDGGPRSATVIAETEVRLLAVPAWSFNATIKSEPSIAVTMLRELARRLRDRPASDD
ncbi:MAG: family transcriptional regulator, cyclic receptor protein [Actinomycetota bacterium]|jgi:CRP-like cAMP-binding protein|nr:family transcriptional regulator, cyclic receptor protein [Actinomycetota bacterium]